MKGGGRNIPTFFILGENKFAHKLFYVVLCTIIKNIYKMKKLLFTIAIGFNCLTMKAQVFPNNGILVWEGKTKWVDTTKKTILTPQDSSILTLNNRVKALEDETYLAGYELGLYHKQQRIGKILTIAGSLGTLAGSTLIATSRNIPVYTTYWDMNTGQSYNVVSGYKTDMAQKSIGVFLSVIGGASTLTGLCYTLEAPLHLEKASLILKANSATLNIKL
jgi:hypothetical protein